jgi:hypothetical protein
MTLTGDDRPLRLAATARDARSSKLQHPNQLGIVTTKSASNVMTVRDGVEHLCATAIAPMRRKCPQRTRDAARMAGTQVVRERSCGPFAPGSWRGQSR